MGCGHSSPNQVSFRTSLFFNAFHIDITGWQESSWSGDWPYSTFRGTIELKLDNLIHLSNIKAMRTPKTSSQIEHKILDSPQPSGSAAVSGVNENQT